MILAVMLYGGIFGIMAYFYTMYLSFHRVWSVEDRTSNCIYASIVILSVMMLMEYFPLSYYFYLLVLAYYYPEFHRQQTGPETQEA